MIESGLDLLLKDVHAVSSLREKRVGVLCHAASITRRYRHILRALDDVGIEVERIFSPEHGLWGIAQDMESVEGGVDPILGKEVISLYGSTEESLKPGVHLLDGLDVVLIDIVDVGSRYYTYVATACYLMQAALRTGIEAIILDRMNPLSLDVTEGNIIRQGYESFVGMLPVPNRHGMTSAELMLYYLRLSQEEALPKIYKVSGLRPDLYFDDTDLPWLLPSPNMVSSEAALLYPGQCLWEGTNVSEGRGTTTPFLTFGAPWFRCEAVCDAFECLVLPGVSLEAVAFRPMFQKYAGRVCKGFSMRITDKKQFKPLFTSIALLQIVYQLHPEFEWRSEAYEFVDQIPAIDLLLGDGDIRHSIESGVNPLRILEAMNEGAREFESVRRQFALYDRSEWTASATWTEITETN